MKKIVAVSSSIALVIVLFLFFISIPFFVLRWPPAPSNSTEKFQTHFSWGPSLLDKLQHSKPDNEKIEQIKNSGCNKYSDGCNTITMQDGSWSTTLIACKYFREPKCLEQPEK